MLSSSAPLIAFKLFAKIPKIDSPAISILKNSFSPNLVPEMSSPVEVVILSLTPGEGAVEFKIEEGVEIWVPPSIVLENGHFI